jgi:hypothetical protein
MDRRRAAGGRAHRLLLAGTLGVALLGAMPWSAAADESAPPESSAEPTATTEPAPSPTEPAPSPTAPPEPTPAPPTPAPAPAAAPEPTTASDSDPTDTPSPTATQTPSPTATPSPSSPTYALASVNLYRSTAMVRQYTSYWCVPATVQSMANLILRTSNRTYSRQGYIYRLTRLHNRYRYATRGNDPTGWAWSLRYFTGGRNYQARAFSDKTAAINAIAASIAKFRHPVGVTVRKGTHAWVVLGYKQYFDPSEPSKKTLLGLYVSGPLGTTADRWPYKYLTVAQFREVFTRYHEWQRPVPWEGKWVIVNQ